MEEEKSDNSINKSKIKLREKNIQNSNFQKANILYNKNVQKINSLKSLIIENKAKFELKTKILENDIINLKNKLASSKVYNCEYNKKDLEQNLIKQKIITNTISIYQEECDSIKENIKMLEEENNNCNFQLYNLISMKDNFEEIIKENSKYIFKNLMISYDQNIEQSLTNNLLLEQSQKDIFNNKNNISIEFYDINNIQSLQKFSNYIYKILSSNITSLINVANIKSLIFSTIGEIFYDFMENKINCEDFIKNIAYKISISDDKIHNFTIISRFEMLLKYILKVFSLDKIINDYVQFLNADFSYSKNFFQKKYNNIKIKIQNCTKEKIEEKKIYINQDKENNKKIESLDLIEKIKNEINEKEEKLTKEKNKYFINDINYKNKIKKLEIINKNIYSNDNDFQKTIENIKENIDNLTEIINNKKNIKNNNNKDNMIKSDCYILISNIFEDINFDPLENYDIKPEIKGYSKSVISLENNIISIYFNQIKENSNIKIKTTLIKKIIVHQNMKKIIYYMKKCKKEKNNIKLLLNDENINKNEINFDELIKCMYNKYFSISIILSDKKIINIIFLTYISFKTWLKILDKFCQNNN